MNPLANVMAGIAASTDSPHANMMAGMGLGIVLFFILIAFAFVAFWIFLYWRVFTKAGLSGALSLIILFPFFGYLIVLCILAFAEWKVVPAPGYGSLPPQYPPPSYPPAQY